ncbi:hypothetical protein K2173_003346 [Erythroxylum novogranatense]|uniref:Uncharacterized protein n=1 Tax=Erythroxylum novogranatense TaxID=1862640 RepID=A0AAV8S8D1_9ROSI|nr:hypothetical protein K2173_003346 [Erythroxylum novogranatense]
MGSEAKTEPWSTPRLPLLSSQLSHGLVQSPERSGTLSPPLYTSASVPFRWEEEPGKPRHCTTPSNTVDSSPKCLEPPPRLLLDAYIARQPSPITVLDGPYMGRSSRFQSFSFRIIRRERHGSFRRSCSSPQRSQLGATVFNKKGVFGSWRWGTRAFKGKREVVGGSSHVFPSLFDREADNEEEDNNGSKLLKFTKTKRPGSFSAVSHAKPPFWVSSHVFNSFPSETRFFLYSSCFQLLHHETCDS